MLNLLYLPHSGATVERMFFAVNRMKTKLRNHLSTATLTGLLHTKRLFSTSRTYFGVSLPPQMLALMNDNMYSVSKETEDCSD